MLHGLELLVEKTDEAGFYNTQVGGGERAQRQRVGAGERGHCCLFMCGFSGAHTR